MVTQRPLVTVLKMKSSGLSSSSSSIIVLDSSGNSRMGKRYTLSSIWRRQNATEIHR